MYNYEFATFQVGIGVFSECVPSIVLFEDNHISKETNIIHII